MGYHEYFATVYRVEQQRILYEQINMIDYALELISMMENGGILTIILKAEKGKEKLIMQIMMEKYLKSFKYF